MMQNNDLWVFGYGSLMWDPGFPFVDRARARLDGFSRRFALWSWHYRGTVERPGLVLGLDWTPGQACDGMAFRIAPEHDRATRDYLQRRELVSYAYFETCQSIRIFGSDGQARTVQALCYILDRSHAQYAGSMTPHEQAQHIAGASGLSGPNTDYLRNTCAHLEELGIRDPGLVEIDQAVMALSATDA